MAGILENLAMGLRQAGGVLNPAVQGILANESSQDQAFQNKVQLMNLQRQMDMQGPEYQAKLLQLENAKVEAEKRAKLGALVRTTEWASATPKQRLEMAASQGLIDPLAMAKEDLASNKPVAVGSGGLAVPDGKGSYNVIGAKQQPPTTRNMRVGDQQVTQQWDPQTNNWVEVARGPAFARQVPPVVVTGSHGPKYSNVQPDGKGGWIGLNKDTGQMEPIKSAPGVSGNDEFSPEALDLKAHQLISGDPKALVNLGRGAQGARHVVQITNRAAEIMSAQGVPPGEIATRMASFRANAQSLTKLTAQYDAVTAFENTAIRNGEILIDLAKKVDTTGIPVIERWVRAGRQQVAGDPDVSQFNTQMSLFRSEAAKIITNPNLTGVLTDNARKEIEEALPSSATAQQIEKVVRLLERDFKNRKQTVEHQIEAIRGRMTANVGPGQGSPSAPTPQPVPQPSAQPAPQPPADKFEVGKVYVDSKGNRARYKGNGQWETK